MRCDLGPVVYAAAGAVITTCILANVCMAAWLSGARRPTSTTEQDDA